MSSLCWVMHACVPLCCVAGVQAWCVQALRPTASVCISFCHLDTDAGCMAVFSCCSSQPGPPPWLPSCWLSGQRRALFPEGSGGRMSLWRRSPLAEAWQRPIFLGQGVSGIRLALPSVHRGRPGQSPVALHILCGFQLQDGQFFWLEPHSVPKPRTCVPAALGLE